MTDNLKEREAFETWFRENYHERLDRNMPDKSYNSPAAFSTWKAWQARAAIDAALAARGAVPAGWVPLSDSQWVDIVNANNAWYGFTKSEAVNEAVKLAEARLKESNAAPQQVAQPWLPIETAPKDGTNVLVHPGTWNDKTCSIAKFDRDTSAKKPRPFWSRDDDFGRVTYSRETPPTHWMPLPAAPQKPKD